MTGETCRWCMADTYRLGRCPRCGEPAEPQGRWRLPEQAEADDMRARLLIDLHVTIVQPARFANADAVRSVALGVGGPVLALQAAQELLVSVADAPDDLTRERACAWAERADPAFGRAARAFAWGLRHSEAAHTARA